MPRLSRIAVVLVALLVVTVAPSRAQNASAAFALQFDGTDDFVAIPTASELGGTPRDERSIEAWFKVDDATLDTRKQVIWEEGGVTNGFNLYVFDGAVYVGAWSEANGFGGEWLQTSSIQSGTWHHVALVYDNTSGSFTGYLDGSAFGSVGVSNTIDSHGDDIAFGRMQKDTKFHDGNAAGDGHEFQGSIDEGRVWNTVRTQSQIQNNRFSTLSGSETGLGGYWPFEEGSGTTTSDLAGGNDGTLQNGVAWTSDTAPLSRTLFVDKDATGANDGTSWADAFTDLQDALATATATDEIWIAEGTYTPTSGTDRSASFTVTGAQDGLEIYGGFANGDAFDDRSPADHPVVLSGDIGTADDKSDNSFHVLVFDGTTGGTITTNTVLDGVTVTAGNADGSGTDNKGGGLFCKGRGSGNGCSPQIRNVTFSANAAANGGAIYSDGRNEGASTPQITNVTFSGNTVSSQGGAIYSDGRSNGTSTLQVTNVTFSGNSASNQGGAIYNQGTGGTSSLQFTNAILWGNSATNDGDEIFNNSASPTLSHTIIEGGVNGSGVGGDANNDGGNNLDADPLFLDPNDPDGDDDVFATDDDGLHVQAGSAAIDAGDNASVPSGVTTDVTGAARTQNGTVDLGAYEGGVDPALTFHVDANTGDDANDGQSWGQAFATLQKALSVATDNDEIWIAEGTYHPDEGPGVTDDDREASFTVTGAQDGLKIYGGFANGDIFADRSPADHPVVLSGDVGTAGDDADNSFHVLVFDGGDGIRSNVAENVTTATLLDGVTVTAGNADGPPFAGDHEGGGLNCDGLGSGNECSPTLANVTFSNNHAEDGGGAIFNNGEERGTSSPQITNAVFTGNSTTITGGAMKNSASLIGTTNPQITNAVFVGNSARSGGAIYNTSPQSGSTSSPQITNAVFTGNTASFQGGAIHNDGRNGTSDPSITNTILYGNSASDSGDEIYNVNATPTLRHTLIEGGVNGPGVGGGSNNDGGNNLDADPLFVNSSDPDGADDTFATGDDGLRLQPDSPALDAGDDTALPNDVADLDGDGNTSETIPHDLVGAERVQNNTVDLGAYEVGLTLFVDTDATGAGNGTSWTDAFTNLQDALSVATGDNEIWIAEGTYHPDEGPGVTDYDRGASFTVTGAQDGLEIYGGFAGGETDRGDRDPVAHPVVLSGDIGTADDNADNSFHVLLFDGGNGTRSDVAENVTTATRLDGVTVTGGNAEGGGRIRGGGLYCDGEGSGNACNPTIANTIFTNNNAGGNGGAIYNDGRGNGTSSPQIVHSTFSGNSASNEGGGIFNDGRGGTSSPQITNATFSGNSATSQGGAIFNNGRDGGNSSPQIVNATFTVNSTGRGGALLNNGRFGTSTPTIDNAILYGNSASSGHEIYNNGGASATISHTLIEGGVNGPGVGGGSSNNNGGNNLDADPLFLDPNDPDGDDDVFATDDDGLHVQAGSAAIDAGDDTALPGDVTTDITGAARIQDSAVDLGAYEGAVPVTLTIDGTPGADGADAGWRFVGVPTTSAVPAGDLRLGGTAPSFTLPSGHMLQEWDDQQGSGTTGGYDPIENAEETLQPGRGYAVFLFDQDPYPVDPSMTISLAGDHALGGNQTITVSGLAETAQWHLLANPYPGGFDLSGFTDLPGNGFQAQIQRYDATDGTWELTMQGDADLSAWQGFFIERTDPGGTTPGATSATFDPAGRIPDPPFVGSKAEEKAPPVQQARLALGLSVTSTEGDTLSKDAAAQVLFDERATEQWDAWDASKLEPLSPQYALLAPVGPGRDTAQVQKAVESRPWPSERQEIPLRITATGLEEGQEAILTVRDWVLPDGWRARIVDTETGRKHALGPGAAPEVTLPADSTQETPRYELQVAPKGTPLPVELAAFEATETGEGAVRLTWQTASETNNAGFAVQRRIPDASDGRPTETWTRIGYRGGAGTTEEPKTYRFADADPPFAADTLSYRLLQVDTDGTTHPFEVVTVARSAVQEVQLHGSFPNPARTRATIRYALPQATEIRIEVYDLLGRRVRTLANGRQKAGRKELELDVDRLASGTYFYRLTAGGTTKTRKMTVVR